MAAPRQKLNFLSRTFLRIFPAFCFRIAFLCIAVSVTPFEFQFSPVSLCRPPPAEHENVSLKLIPFSFGVVAIKRVRDFPFCSQSHRDYKSFLGAFNVAHAREAIA